MRPLFQYTTATKQACRLVECAHTHLPNVSWVRTVCNLLDCLPNLPDNCPLRRFSSQGTLDCKHRLDFAGKTRRMHANPLINTNPVLCVTENSVSIVRSWCRTRLHNQLSAYAAVRYFQHKYGMTPLLEPFQMKIIKSVFNEKNLTVRSLNLDFCCNQRKKWKMIMALKEDKRTGISTGLTEKFETNPEYYSRNFVIGLGHHTMPLFLFKGKYIEQIFSCF